LLMDQRRAFDVVYWHAMQPTDNDRKPPPLLMQIQGEGGTGKSRVIQTISAMFKMLGREQELVKAAYTGIAAPLIDGKTTH
ncbi:hypothetical protein BC834DRAFT_785293, partial [Gloeopeniophorella convolvens]